MDVSEDDEDTTATKEEQQLQARKEKELARLHKIGIPVPGVQIKWMYKDNKGQDKMMEAKVWLEDLEVESDNRVFKERVRAVVERAVEVVAPLWG